MENAVKRILKILPFAKNIYTQLHILWDIAEIKKLFVDHKLYLSALKQKGLGTVNLKTHDGLNITIRQNIWDAWIVKEIFINQPYIRYFELSASPTIVDVGGYIGDFSIYAVKHLNANRVIVYEPTAENFEILKQNIENNAFEKQITAVNKAVSNSKEVMLNVEIQECDEIHVSAYWYLDAQQRIIPSVTLADILEIHQLDSVDLLKVDCEGGEYDIFPTVSDMTYSRIRNIVFEYHNVDGFNEKFELVLNRLRSAGYTLRVERKIVYAYRA